jgi:hypothetical protein
MPDLDQALHSWHQQPDIAHLSPESFTAQKLVHGSVSLQYVQQLTRPATRNPRAPLPHLEALLHRPHTRMQPHSLLIRNAHVQL